MLRFVKNGQYLLFNCKKILPLQKNNFNSEFMNDSIGTFFVWVKNNKYWFVTITFLLIIVFFDENNLIKHFQNQREITILKSEIQELKEELEVLTYKSSELHKDIEIMEKVAREKYGMHKDGEEVFIVED